MSVTIDLNSDLGELEDRSLDAAIMPFISSCNIACGGHAGDEDSITRTVELAAKYHVAIGAHPSFPDRENFGREVIQMEPEKLQDSLQEQIALVQSITKQNGMSLHHVKPHGALYNVAAKDPAIAKIILQSVKGVDPSLKIYGLAHSTMEMEAKNEGTPFVAEAFADRKYEDDKTLRSRKKEDAVLNEKEVLEQVEKLVFSQKVYASTWMPIHAQTVCLHSDTPGAVTLARRIHEHLVNKGAVITSV